MKLIPYGKQWIDDDDVNAIVSVLKGDWLTQGPHIGQFEKAIAAYCGVKYAVAVSSGTAALHIACLAVGLEKGDFLWTSPNTFVASANCAMYCGARPDFVDIDPFTYNMSVDALERKLFKAKKNETIPKVVVPVHFAGQSCDMEQISQLAKKYKFTIIEDASHSLGAKYKEEKIGSCKYSDITVFSFHPVKHITTGEGGALLTNCEEYYEKLLMLRTHGIVKDNFVNESVGDWYYEMHFLGYNYRITDIQASLGISQLKKLDMFVKRRREIAKIYEEAFKDNPYFDTPVEKEYSFSSYHLYPIKLKDEYKDKKRKIFSKLREKGLGIQVHYIPVYFQPYYQRLGYKKGLCPFAEDFYNREISFPMYPSMSEEDTNYVIETSYSVFKEIQRGI